MKIKKLRKYYYQIVAHFEGNYFAVKPSIHRCNEPYFNPSIPPSKFNLSMQNLSANIRKMFDVDKIAPILSAVLTILLYKLITFSNKMVSGWRQRA